MKITSAVYVKGITGSDPILHDGKFHVVFMGRSNVGKSTLINSLTRMPSLSRTSSTPGKTMHMDFFFINKQFYFLDFPGYGYARRTPMEREKLAKMILWYLRYSEVKKRVVILIIDTKVGVTAFDVDILRTLREEKIEHIIVANKIDNVPQNMKEKQLAMIRAAYGDSPVLTYSSKTHIGRKELLEKISAYTNSVLPS
ncbi:MAG: ribosome biogenesis GTP-binding protein YihA/YsxC [Patescibacteria group bacterium]